MQATHQKQEHTASYYAASVNDRSTYPALNGHETADVCIVGAGFTGISAALTLAERGYSVAVVEANRVGWGASGRNGGQVINGISGLEKIAKAHGEDIADLVWDLRWRGNELIRERIATYAIDCDFKEGFIEAAVKPRQLRDIEELAEERERRRFPFRYAVWDRDQTREQLGTDAFHGAFACFRDGHVHPLNLVLGETRAAIGLGAKIFEQSPVTSIEHGERPTVRTASGDVRANAVIIAGNAYSRLEAKHLSNLVFPAGSYIIATEPLSDALAREINHPDAAVSDLNVVVDYFRLSADKRLLYGGACNYSGREPASIQDYIRPRMLKTYPQLKDLRIDYEWGGKIGIVLNRVVSVGRIDGNVYYSQGYNGHGLAASHVMGEVLADAIAGTLERFDLFADVKHFRLPGTRWFGNQLIALGMLYYKLKDRL